MDAIGNAPTQERPSGQDGGENPRRATLAHVLPFGLFMLFIMLVGATDRIGQDLGLGRYSRFFLESAYIIYPLQTLACGAALLWFWNSYRFKPHAFVMGLLAGIAALLIWIAPQELLQTPGRMEGFDPTQFTGAGYWFTLIVRFIRLVIVVPLLEEIFWRGFLMRYLIDGQRFDSIPFGTFRPGPFLLVAFLFMLVHQPADYAAAFLTGCLYNGLACKTRSLSACVFAHATTNLLLGLYVMKTQQWGFW